MYSYLLKLNLKQLFPRSEMPIKLLCVTLLPTVIIMYRIVAEQKENYHKAISSHDQKPAV